MSTIQSIDIAHCIAASILIRPSEYEDQMIYPPTINSIIAQTSDVKMIYSI